MIIIMVFWTDVSRIVNRMLKPSTMEELPNGHYAEDLQLVSTFGSAIYILAKYLFKLLHPYVGRKTIYKSQYTFYSHNQKFIPDPEVSSFSHKYP